MSKVLMKKKDFMWNTAAGMINAAQSAVILIFISRGLGAEAAGIFTIGYALANLFCTIGKYAIRNYQVTDIKEENSFSDYFLLRVITVLFSIIMMVAYVYYQHIIGNYTYNKLAVVVLLVLWKLVDAVEDVFYGMYQQHNRLDIGSRCYCIRLLCSSVLYCVMVVLGIELVWSTAITVLFSILMALIMIKSTWRQFNVSLLGAKVENVKVLFINCLPLCIGTSLSIYVGNIPKYLIDAHMDETTQAYFGFLMMPAFMILILSTFVYHPLVRNFGVMWSNREVKNIIKLICKICCLILVFTGIVVLFGMWIGLDMLSWLYGVDLTSYGKEFLILLVGGGVYAMLSFLVVPLTSIRAQKNIAVGFFIVAIVGLIIGKNITINFGMIGVTMLYLMQNVFLCVFFVFCLFWKMRNKLEVGGKE